MPRHEGHVREMGVRTVEKIEATPKTVGKAAQKKASSVAPLGSKAVTISLVDRAVGKSHRHRPLHRERSSSKSNGDHVDPAPRASDAAVSKPKRIGAVKRRWVRDSEGDVHAATFRYFELSQEYFKTFSALERLQKHAMHLPKPVADQYISMVLENGGDRRRCRICLWDVDERTIELKDCGHVFHSKCIQNHSSCPSCARFEQFIARSSAAVTQTPVVSS